MSIFKTYANKAFRHIKDKMYTSKPDPALEKLSDDQEQLLKNIFDLFSRDRVLHPTLCKKISKKLDVKTEQIKNVWKHRKLSKYFEAFEKKQEALDWIHQLVVILPKNDGKNCKQETDRNDEEQMFVNLQKKFAELVKDEKKIINDERKDMKQEEIEAADNFQKHRSTDITNIDDLAKINVFRVFASTIFCTDQEKLLLAYSLFDKTFEQMYKGFCSEGTDYTDRDGSDEGKMQAFMTRISALDFYRNIDNLLRNSHKPNLVF